MDGAELISRLRQIFEKYRYVLLVLLIGVFLMLYPSKSSTASVATPEKETVIPGLAAQLEAVLSGMEGAGKVKVLLSESASAETIFQSDAAVGGDSHRSETVLTMDTGRNQTGLVRKVVSPIYQGAVVLAQGADRASVKLEITQAVSSATGLGYDQITVLKMK